MVLKQSATRYKQKTEIFIVKKSQTWLKPQPYFWLLRQEKKEIRRIYN